MVLAPEREEMTKRKNSNIFKPWTEKDWRPDLSSNNTSAKSKHKSPGACIIKRFTAIITSTVQ